MNKKAQTDWEELIKLIIALPILLAIVAAIFGTISQLNQPDCPQCEDCTIYKNQVNNLSQNLSDCLNKTTEIIYKNRTIVEEKPIPEPIGSPPIIYVVIEVSLLVVLIFSITLFKLPEKIAKEVEKYNKIIKYVKIASVVVTFLILIRLIWIFVLMF